MNTMELLANMFYCISKSGYSGFDSIHFYQNIGAIGGAEISQFV